MINITVLVDFCNLHFMVQTAIEAGNYELAHKAIVQMADVVIDGLVTSDKVIDGVLADIAESEG